jgi:RimJ/RimL family protein N-acetyltransferase
MNVREFAQVHLPALERDEVRFNVQIAVLAAAAENAPTGFCHWTLGPHGHCAIKSPGRAILLGNVDRTECRELAQIVRDADYAGVVGADETGHWFAEAARELGAKFYDPIPQRIHVLLGPPSYPAAEGSPRMLTEGDAPLLLDWLTSFQKEAVPNDPPPEKATMETLASSGRFLFWTIADQPVSLAAVARHLRRTGCIAPVYTPPERRGQGYAGSVTAAVADRIFEEGKTAVCLYTDLRNPMSNRCYAKIGFQPYCDSSHHIRVL